MKPEPSNAYFSLSLFAKNALYANNAPTKPNINTVTPITVS